MGLLFLCGITGFCLDIFLNRLNACNKFYFYFPRIHYRFNLGLKSTELQPLSSSSISHSLSLSFVSNCFPSSSCLLYKWTGKYRFISQRLLYENRGLFSMFVCLWCFRGYFFLCVLFHKIFIVSGFFFANRSVEWKRKKNNRNQLFWDTNVCCLYCVCVGISTSSP